MRRRRRQARLPERRSVAVRMGRCYDGMIWNAEEDGKYRDGFIENFSGPGRLKSRNQANREDESKQTFEVMEQLCTSEDMAC